MSIPTSPDARANDLAVALQGTLSSERSVKAKAILTGAFLVFTRQGYSAATMDRIAAAAKVSKTTLYSHFPDKEGLFVALIQDLTQANRQLVFRLLTNADLQAPPGQVLRQMARQIINNISSNPPLLTLVRLIIGESERFPELGKTFVREIQKPILEQLTLYLTAQRQLPLADPAMAARVFVGTLVHYLVVQKLMHGDEVIPIERDYLVEGLVGLLIPTQSPG
jgi:AcrR family transcriptional regulator